MGIEVRAGCVHLESMRAEEQRDGIILPDCGRRRLNEREKGARGRRAGGFEKQKLREEEFKSERRQKTMGGSGQSLRADGETGGPRRTVIVQLRPELLVHGDCWCEGRVCLLEGLGKNHLGGRCWAFKHKVF